MDAIEIFKQTIGERLKPIVVRYEPYKDVFLTHPYSHVIDNDFEKRFGYPMCVGCGRCDDVCPEYISYSNCVNRLAKEENEE